MRKTITASALAFAAFLIIGCDSGGDTPASISKEIAGNMRAMAEIFDGITDEASAKAAVPKIEAVRKNMRDVAARAKALPKMSKSEMDAAEATMQKDMMEVMGKLGASRMKLQTVIDKHPEVEKILEPALANMENDM